MFTTRWQTSQKRHGMIVERDVKIPVRDGTRLNADIFRPDAEGRFPAILGYHPYNLRAQTAPIRPNSFASIVFPHPGMEMGNGPLEAGDPNFYVSRGYVHVICNVRGTGESEGVYPALASPEPEDGSDVIEWIAQQPWCDGNVSMFGVSYFAWVQQFVASTNPPHLKCIFAPWAATDLYRDAVYHGGILGFRWAATWARALDNCRYESELRKEWGDEAYEKAIRRALDDPELAGIPDVIQALKNPDAPENRLFVDIVLSPHDGSFWEKRKVRYESVTVPAYLGGCWAIYGLHLGGAFRSWENWRAPKRMLLAPPAYLDRPVYQLQYESLRWFDYWLKGIPTEIMDEPPVRAYVMSTGQWKHSEEWPPPETKWIPFNLHEGHLLWEREHFPHEGATSYSDSPWGREYVEFTTPKLAEETEVVGPPVLNLYASTSDEEVLFFVSLRDIDAEANERVLTRGWLRGSHRQVDPDRSLPWRPYHPHSRPEPLTPGRVYLFQIPILPTAKVFPVGSRIKLRISSVDDEPTDTFEAIAAGHVRRRSPSRVTVHHNSEHPSHLLLPVTRGNVVGTYITGAHPYINPAARP